MTEPKNIREFIDWAISNQEDLKKENAPAPFPDWNKGYLEALNDCKSKIIYPIDIPLNDRLIHISILLGSAVVAIDQCLSFCDLELLKRAKQHLDDQVNKIFYGKNIND